jgi:hypothetical protein
MLVAAFATLSSTTQNLRLHLIEFAVGLTGVIFTAFQCWMSVSVAEKLYKLKPELERLDKIYEQHRGTPLGMLHGTFKAYGCHYYWEVFGHRYSFLP